MLGRRRSCRPCINLEKFIEYNQSKTLLFTYSVTKSRLPPDRTVGVTTTAFLRAMVVVKEDTPRLKEQADVRGPLTNVSAISLCLSQL